ncbi:MAG: valine--tRNA ligase [Erysipelotrichaceae bacterium]|nr:valine--tRNA ligase [Erysipelotrichaceae bacterium]
MESKYNHLNVEKGKYQSWLEKKVFEAGDMSKKPYCIVIPPPNVTGKLHLGHAMDNTLQDLISRYQRLKGRDVLWVPGMDHAGIATQAKVDARLKEQGLSRYDLGREKFLDKAWEWKREYADFIHQQWATLGNSVDYSRERFTLDEGLSKAVTKVFVDYYKEGLIYQGLRIINWDPEAKTALSNIEVIYKEVKGKMYYFKYPFEDGLGHIEVATTRPETMFGDVCVVVNPKDDQYQNVIGKKVINPANKQAIPIIADDYIEIGFGTGAMKCTPAHDPNDYQIGLRHHLAMPICMNPDATMNELAGEYCGLDRFECRKKLVEQIKAEGNFIKAEDIVHNVGHSERTDTMVEPYLSKQWFVKMKPLADAVLKAQDSDDQKINFYPKRFENTFKQWLDNIEDWCISRQLWWGHRIPVYYHKDTGEIYCEVDKPLDIENYLQDEDVLDTWFSSALWPFSVLGWPEKTADLSRYYPTSCMVTGYDIIFFWVARMAFSARYFTNQVPFKDCLIHGLIRDSQGRKMSKSLGNGIDPMDVINKYGCDSLRFFLATSSTPGLDMNFNEEKIEAAWNFINKLWNASRYVMMNIKEGYTPKKPTSLNASGEWILNRLNETIKQVTMNMDRYEFAMAGNELYNFVWDDYCSNYIEFSKIDLNDGDDDSYKQTIDTLVYVLKEILILLHPYLPFVTEEIYQNLFNDKDISIVKEEWPLESQQIYTKVNDVNILIEIIKQIRELKNDNGVKPSKILRMLIDGEINLDSEILNILKNIAKVEVVEEITGEKIIRPISGGNLVFALDEVVDRQAEIAKLEAELIKVRAEIERADKMLKNPNFVNKAPANKVAAEKDKLRNYQNQYETIFDNLKKLRNLL